MGAVGDRKPGLKMVAIGDSIIAGVGAATLDQALVGQVALSLSLRLKRRIDWRAVGKVGARTDTVSQCLLPQLPPEQADLIVISVGVNDLTAVRTRARWRRDLLILLHALRAHSPRAWIAFVGIPPLKHFPLLPQPLRALFGLRAAAFDAVARHTLRDAERMVHVPIIFDAGDDQFSQDGFHPSEASYALLGAAVADALYRATETQ